MVYISVRANDERCFPPAGFTSDDGTSSSLISIYADASLVYQLFNNTSLRVCIPIATFNIVYNAPSYTIYKDTIGWGVSPRGAGYLFGSDVVTQFNSTNDIDMICRAHQLVMEGFKWHFNETVLTVWSAPNYCYRYVQKFNVISLQIRSKRFPLFLIIYRLDAVMWRLYSN